MHEFIGVSDDKANRSGRKGMVLPFQPLFLTFDEIKYSLDMAQEMKKQGVFEERRELLKGVSGVFRPRVLTALMGVSGAGYNPATWMLEVTSAGIEASLKVNFTNVYRKSELYRLDSLLNPTNIVFTFNLQNCHLAVFKYVCLCESVHAKWRK
ncbi:ABC transporter G family member 35 [Glycine max]|nr:ABC transporter G family member 35 [Glycine max]